MAASFVNELSFTNQLPLSFGGRNQLQSSAATISAWKTFLTQLGSGFRRFSKACAGGKYNIESLRSIGDIITNSATAFETIGGLQKGVNISKGREYVNKVVAQLNKIENLGIGSFECTSSGDFSVAARTLEDLATLIDDVGINNLSNQLGVVLSFQK